MRSRKLPEESGLPFKAHLQFGKSDREERGNLYFKLAEVIWNPTNALREAAGT
jgi:hypothetical protein